MFALALARRMRVERLGTRRMSTPYVMMRHFKIGCGARRMMGLEQYVMLQVRVFGPLY